MSSRAVTFGTVRATSYKPPGKSRLGMINSNAGTKRQRSPAQPSPPEKRPAGEHAPMETSGGRRKTRRRPSPRKK